MQRTAQDYRRLIELISHLEGEGLYWLPALHILIAAKPELLSLHGSPNSVLSYIDVDPDPGIDFEGMLRELDWSEPVREMVKVAWALFNGGRFDDPGAPTEERIHAPRFDDIVCRLDLRQFTVVLEAMRVRKGKYGAPRRTPPRTETQREVYRHMGLPDDMIDKIVEDAERQIEHDQTIERIRHRLLDRINAFVLESEAQANAEIE